MPIKNCVKIYRNYSIGSGSQVLAVWKEWEPFCQISLVKFLLHRYRNNTQNTFLAAKESLIVYMFSSKLLFSANGYHNIEIKNRGSLLKFFNKLVMIFNRMASTFFVFYFLFRILLQIESVLLKKDLNTIFKYFVFYQLTSILYNALNEYFITFYFSS